MKILHYQCVISLIYTLAIWKCTVIMLAARILIKNMYNHVFPIIFIKFWKIGNQFIFHALVDKARISSKSVSIKEWQLNNIFFPFKSSDIFRKCYHTSWNIQTCIMIVSVLIHYQFISENRLLTLTELSPLSTELSNTMVVLLLLLQTCCHEDDATCSCPKV